MEEAKPNVKKKQICIIAGLIAACVLVVVAFFLSRQPGPWEADPKSQGKWAKY
jgi:uncharacterized membrane protein YvbJ